MRKKCSTISQKTEMREPGSMISLKYGLWSVCHKLIISRERDVMASLYPWYDVPRASRRVPQKVSIPEPEQKTVTKISVPWQALFFNPMLRG